MADQVEQTEGQQDHILLGGVKKGIQNYTDLKETVVYVAGALSRFLKRYDRDRRETGKEIKVSEKAAKDYAKGEVDAGLQKANTYTNEEVEGVRSGLTSDIDDFKATVNGEVAGVKKDVAEKHDAIDKLIAAHKADVNAFEERQEEKDNSREERVNGYLDRATAADLVRHEAFETNYRTQLDDANLRIFALEGLLLQVGEQLAQQTGNDSLLVSVREKLEEVRAEQATAVPADAQAPPATGTGPADPGATRPRGRR